MKLIILKNNLVEGLGFVEGSVGADTNLPILKNIFLGTDQGKISLTATNLEIAAKHIISGKIIETGAITVPFLIFWNIIKNLSSERITLEAKGKNLVITTDNYEASVFSQDAKDFPIIPAIQNSKSLKINIGVFRESLANVIVAAQYSEVRPEISGVLINFQSNRLVFVATDSFRLAEVAVPQDQTQSATDEFSVIIPLKTASELLRVLGAEEDGSAEIFIDPNQILFEMNGNSIISRLIDGAFPDYKAVIPREAKTEVTLNRQEITNAIKLTRVFAGRTNDITLKVGDNKKFLEVYSADSALGENLYKVPIKLKGDKFSIAFNWRFILDGFKIYKNEEITLSITERPVLIKSANEPHLLYIVMPIKS